MNFQHSLRRIFMIIPEEDRKKFRWFCAGSLISGLLDLMSVAYLIPAILLLIDKKRLDTILRRFDASFVMTDRFIVTAIACLVAFYLLKNWLQTKYNSALQKFLYGMAHHLSESLLLRYMNGQYLDYQQSGKGELTRSITVVTRDFAVTLLGSLLTLTSETAVFIAIVTGMLYFYFFLTMGALTLTCIFAFFIYRIKRAEMRLINSTYRDAATEAQNEVINIIDGYMEIRSSGRQEKFLSRFNGFNIRLNRVTALLNAASGNYSRYLEVFLITGIAGLLLYSYATGAPADPWLISILGALSIKLIPSLTRILNSVTLFNAHRYSIGKLISIPATQSRQAHPEFESRFEWHGLSFGYENNPLFIDVDFSISKGEVIGISGHTGVGKTTLLHIISGIQKPQHGSLEIDGKKLSPLHWPAFASYVPQQPFLFSATILENITMLAPEDETDEAYIAFLLEKLHLSDLIDRQKDGIRTHIGHNAATLSGGQKQRLALVRALYQRPGLLILDEATNQQHDAMELEILQFIRELADAKKLAVIMVSHHPGMRAICDRAFVLSGKKLVDIP